MNQLQACQYQLAATPWASATTERTAALDTSTYAADYVSIVVPLGIEANTNNTGVAIVVSHSDDTVVTNHATIGSTTADNTAAMVVAFNINMKGKKRYLRVVATPDTTTNGAVLVGGVVAIINPENRGLSANSTGSVVNIA